MARHRSRTAIWDLIPVNYHLNEHHLVTKITAKGGTGRHTDKQNRTVEFSIPNKAVPANQGPYSVRSKVYSTLKECVSGMPDRTGLGAHISKGKYQLETEDNGNGGKSDGGNTQRPPTAPDDTDLIAPVFEIHGDIRAPDGFLQYATIKLEHWVTNQRELAYVQVDCYRINKNGKRVIESVPNRAVVLDRHPDAYYEIDSSHITIYTKHFCWYICRKGHERTLALDYWIVPEYHFQNDRTRQKLKLNTYITRAGVNKEAFKQELIAQGKVDGACILDDGMESRRLDLPDEKLNHRGKANVYLTITDRQWQVYGQNQNQPLKPIKRSSKLGPIFGCEECGCPGQPGITTYDLQRKLESPEVNRATRFEGKLVLQIKPYVNHGKKLFERLRELLWCLNEVEEVEEEEVDQILEDHGMNVMDLDIALPEAEIERPSDVVRPRVRPPRVSESHDSGYNASLEDPEVKPEEVDALEALNEDTVNDEPNKHENKINIDDKLLRKITKENIHDEETLLDFSFEFGWTDSEIRAAKSAVSSGNHYQMAAYSLIIQWNNSSDAGGESKLHQICAALDSIGKNAYAKELKDSFS